jgi:hypothetical protein
MVRFVAALTVNEWRDKRELQSQVTEARRAFGREIEANRKTVLDEKTGLPNHKAMLSKYQSVGLKPVLTAADLQPIYDEFPQGINMVRLRDAVWRSLSGSDVLRRLDQRDLFSLAEIYRQQEEIDDYNRAMYGAWRQVNADADTPAYLKDSVRSTRAYLADVIAAEERLRRLYEEATGRFRSDA